MSHPQRAAWQEAVGTRPDSLFSYPVTDYLDPAAVLENVFASVTLYHSLTAPESEPKDPVTHSRTSQGAVRC